MRFISVRDHDKFLKKFIDLGLQRKFESAKKKFIHTNTGTLVQIIIEGEVRIARFNNFVYWKLYFVWYPDDRSIGPVVFPNPKEYQQFLDDMHVISLSKLIDLKLTSYRSTSKTRLQDADDSLHLSVRTEFQELVDDLNKEKLKGSMDNE